MPNTHRTRSVSHRLFTLLLLVSLLLAAAGAISASAQQLARPRPVAKRAQVGAAPVFLSDEKDPDEWVEVIVQGREGANVFSLALASGGQVTHRLDLINGVGLRVQGLRARRAGSPA